MCGHHSANDVGFAPLAGELSTALAELEPTAAAATGNLALGGLGLDAFSHFIDFVHSDLGISRKSGDELWSGCGGTLVNHCVGKRSRPRHHIATACTHAKHWFGI